MKFLLIYFIFGLAHYLFTMKIVRGLPEWKTLIEHDGGDGKAETFGFIYYFILWPVPVFHVIYSIFFPGSDEQ